MVDMTIGRLWGVGYGSFYWFSWDFFPKPLWSWNFFPQDINGIRFSFSIIRYERYFFQCRVFFPRNLFACFFPPEISLQDIFFLKSPITPSKVKWSAPKIHQTFGQLTDSDLSIISKGFWNNREQNSLGERGGIRFYWPLLSPHGSTYGRTVTS